MSSLVHPSLTFRDLLLRPSPPTIPDPFPTFSDFLRPFADVLCSSPTFLGQWTSSAEFWEQGEQQFLEELRRVRSGGKQAASDGAIYHPNEQVEAMMRTIAQSVHDTEGVAAVVIGYCDQRRGR